MPNIVFINYKEKKMCAMVIKTLTWPTKGRFQKAGAQQPDWKISLEINFSPKPSEHIFLLLAQLS